MNRLNCALLAVIAAVAVASPGWAAKTTLTMGVVLEPPHLDPTAGAAAAIDEIVYANLFEGLTRIDATGAIKPGLAESWSISPDGLVYTFALRSGVTFHDGAAFDASDVVFSYDRARAEASTNAQKGLFAPITAITALDPVTVQITLNQPVGNFLFNMGWGDAVIVDPASAGTNKTTPVGTGPFRFHRWVQGDRVELVAYDGYWGKKPALTAATFKVLTDPAAATAALLAGDVDAFANVPAPEALEQFKADSRFAVVIGTTEGETVLSTNNARPPFNDLRVRQALAHALDRQAIIDGAMFGYGTPIGSHFAPHHPAYVDLTGLYPHDLAKAKALLAEAGFADGFTATLKVPPPSYARRGGEIIAAQLAQIGIKLEIVPVEWAQWLQQVFIDKDYDLSIVSHTEPMDIDIYGRGDKYYFNYQSAAFADVMQRLNAAQAEAERFALMGDAQRQLAQDAVNGFLFQLAKHGVWNARIEGLWHNSPVQANDLTAVWWRE